MGIKLRLLALVLLAAFPVLLVEVWSELEHREQRRDELSQAVLSAARLVASEQDQYFESARNIINTYLQSPTVREGDNAGCSIYLARLVEEFPAYTGFGVASADGTIVCSSNPGFVGRSLADRRYFQETLARQAFAIGDVVRGPSSGQRIVGMSLPLTDDKGNVRLVGVLGLDLEHLSSAMAVPSLREDAAAVVLDAQGTIMARSPEGEGWIGTAAPDDLSPERLLEARGGTLEATDVDGVRRLYGFTLLIEGAPLRIGIGVPAAPLFAEADRLFVGRLTLLVLVFIGAASLAWIGGEVTIRRPLKALQRAIARVAAGDLATRSGTASSVPEFARLGSSFDRMAESLERHEAELQRTNAELRKALADKDVLFREMNHRVKNSLQLVSSMLALQVRRLEDPAARRLLGEAQVRVHTVARMHERLYRTDQIETVEFGHYLRELCADITDALQLEGQDRRIVIEATPAEIPIDQAVHLALIANELITNAFKHAYPEGTAGVVEVRFAIEPSREKRLEVIDHGTGMVSNGEADTRPGIGMSLIKSLVDQIEGRLTVERNDPGTRFIVIVPA